MSCTRRQAKGFVRGCHGGNRQCFPLRESFFGGAELPDERSSHEILVPGICRVIQLFQQHIDVPVLGNELGSNAAVVPSKQSHAKNSEREQVVSIIRLPAPAVPITAVINLGKLLDPVPHDGYTAKINQLYFTVPGYQHVLQLQIAEDKPLPMEVNELPQQVKPDHLHPFPSGILQKYIRRVSPDISHYIEGIDLPGMFGIIRIDEEVAEIAGGLRQLPDHVDLGLQINGIEAQLQSIPAAVPANQVNLAVRSFPELSLHHVRISLPLANDRRPLYKLHLRRRSHSASRPCPAAGNGLFPQPVLHHPFRRYALQTENG